LGPYARIGGVWNEAKGAEWITLCKDAGMGFIVITSKHHDGSCDV
jgi:alpha-L-fucosidase